MRTKLSIRKIKEMCGEISYKRGSRFCAANKVKFEEFTNYSCQAVVYGEEPFYVTINERAEDTLQATCSCPTLLSFDKDCQHIAAVLQALYEHQQQGTNPAVTIFADDVLNLFRTPTVRSSAKQSHFDNRDMLSVSYTLIPKSISDERTLFSLQLKIEQEQVTNILEFLQHVKEGKTYTFPSFSYHPTQYCFDKNDYDILQLLADKSEETNARKQHQLILLPSVWEHIESLLEQSKAVTIEMNAQKFPNLTFTNALLPLMCTFSYKHPSFQFRVEGLDSFVIFPDYSFVLTHGKLRKLDYADCNRLVQLEKMMRQAGRNTVSVPAEQIRLFLENVVTELKKLGYVTIDHSVASYLDQAPLKAKVYVDRLNNKLLLGVEFHYGHDVINPLENKASSSVMIREDEKEKEILETIELAGFAKTEGGYFLHNEALEYEFLMNGIATLQKQAQIYATTAVRNRVVKDNRMQPKIRVRAKRERTNWLAYGIGIENIPETQIKEVLQTLEEKRKYYRLPNGDLLSLETKAYQDLQRFLQTVPDQEKDGLEGELSAAQSLMLLDTFQNSEMLELTHSVKAFVSNLNHPERSSYTIPKDLSSVLTDYQKVGFQWMKQISEYGLGGILADDMGLGKTIQSIAYILSEQHEIRRKKQPALVVCPASLMYNWLNEVKKFAPMLSVSVINGTKHERNQQLNDALVNDLIICSYPILRRDIMSFEKQSFHTLIFDEAQAFKNPLSQTAKAVKKLQASHRFALTGTPIENNIEELWAVFYVVFPELLGNLKQYSELSNTRIAKKIHPFILRRLKKDVLSQLPAKVEMTETVELFLEQKKLYAAYLAKLREDTLKHLDKDTLRKNKIKILAGLTRLRQICCHPVLFVDGYEGKSAKFEQLLEIIEASKQAGRRVLIFSQFTKMLSLIGQALTREELAYFYLDGQTSSEVRVKMCEQFNRGERDFFLISLKAGGTGLNLASADTVILYDTWWNPAVEAQAMDRAHRMGQTNRVEVIKLIAKGTIEEKMNELQQKKRHLIGEVIDADTSTTQILTEEGLKELLDY